MIRGNLEDILKEINGKGVKDPELINQYIRALGQRTLFSLMYGDREHCSDERRYECWSCLEIVPMAYTFYSRCSDENLVYLMKRITLKDFLCLVEHLDSKRQGTVPDRKTMGWGGLGMTQRKKMALAYLLRMLLRAKARGDVDVNHFCVIQIRALVALCEKNYRILSGNMEESAAEEQEGEDEKEKEKKWKKGEREKEQILMADLLYKVKKGINPKELSWKDLDREDKSNDFAILQELLLDSVHLAGFYKNFSWQGTILQYRGIFRERMEEIKKS